MGYDIEISMTHTCDRLLQSDEIPRGASMLLRNLCMGNDPPPSLSYLTPCLATLSRLAFHSDDDISDDNCFALTSLSKIYGPSLSNTLGPAFLSQLLKLQRSVTLSSVLLISCKMLGL